MSPGLRISYWTHGVPLVRLMSNRPSAAEGAVAGAEDGAEAADGLHLEVGIDGSGASVVRHLPPLLPLALRPGDGQPPPSTPVQQRHGHPTRLGRSSLLATVQVASSGGGGVPGEHSRAASEAADAVIAPPELRLDSSYVNVDELLLRSAAHVATAELLSLRTSLEASLAAAGAAVSPDAEAPFSAKLTHFQIPWIRGTVAGASRDAAAASAVESLSVLPVASSSSSSREPIADGAADGSLSGGGGRVMIACPVLELAVDGMRVMTVSKNLFTGRLLVRNTEVLKEIGLVQKDVKVGDCHVKAFKDGSLSHLQHPGRIVM